MEADTNTTDNIFTDVFIRQWAQRIREQKISELKEIIAKKKDNCRELSECKCNTPESSLHKILAQAKIVIDICRLNDKLHILTWERTKIIVK